MFALLPSHFGFYGHKEGVHCCQLTALSGIGRAPYTSGGNLITTAETRQDDSCDGAALSLVKCMLPLTGLPCNINLYAEAT